MSSSIGQAPKPRAELFALAESQLRDKSAWSDAQRKATTAAVAELIQDIPDSPFCAVGLSGAPGSGKSALAHLVCRVSERLGRPALVVSLDDYYLGRLQRNELARTHPLFAQRGVPGTHDWDTLIEHLDRIREGDIDGLRLPRFEKSRDDRSDESEFTHLASPPAVVVLEGWLIGAPPQEASRLREPVNRMEAEQDRGGHWRTLVNEQLARYYRDLQERLSRRWFLAAPDWDSVVDWRWQQEREGIQLGGRHLDSREAVARFLDQFQRIALHMLAGCREWADLVVRLDRSHVMRVDRVIINRP